MFNKELNLGNLIPTKDNSYRVEKTSFDVLWQMDRALAIVIRDYLKSFINVTPAVGNCIGDARYKKDLIGEVVLSEEEIEKYNRKWVAAVNKTADEFDTLRKLIEIREQNYEILPSEDEIKETTQKAFADLAFIFNDLCW